MIIEVVSTITDIPSRKHPRIIKKNVNATNNVVADKFISEIQAAKFRGKPVKPIDIDKNAAPSKINAIMHDVRVADMTASLNSFQLNDPDVNASNVAKTTPKAAASVGDAKPPYMDPTTPPIKMATGMRRRDALILSFKKNVSSIARIKSGFIHALTATYPANELINIKPGKIPAINSRAID